MDKYLNDKQVAEFLGIQLKTLQNRISDGADVPPYIELKTLKRRFYRLSDLHAWIDEQETKDRAPSAGRVR